MKECAGTAAIASHAPGQRIAASKMVSIGAMNAETKVVACLVAFGSYGRTATSRQLASGSLGR